MFLSKFFNKSKTPSKPVYENKYLQYLNTIYTNKDMTLLEYLNSKPISIVVNGILDELSMTGCENHRVFHSHLEAMEFIDGIIQVLEAEGFIVNDDIINNRIVIAVNPRKD